MKMEWKDTAQLSTLIDGSGQTVATVTKTLSSKYLWITIVAEEDAPALDAGTAPNLDEAKSAAVAALPKAKGLRWETRLENRDLYYMDGDTQLCAIRGTHFRFSPPVFVHGEDEEVRKRAAEAAVAVLRGVPAPAPVAEPAGDEAEAMAERLVSQAYGDWFIGVEGSHGGVHSWHNNESPKYATKGIAIGLREFAAAAVKTAIEKRDAKLLDCANYYFGPRGRGDALAALAAIDAEAR